jgi:hypothetical protein
MLPDGAEVLFDVELEKLPLDVEVDGAVLFAAAPPVLAGLLFVENEPPDAAVCGGLTAEPATGLFWNVSDVYECA